MTVDASRFDFGGYATKVDILCADGRTILKDAFKHNHGQKVPLVWQHLHGAPENVLGHAVLENRPDGVYAWCKFNSTPAGQNAKLLVQHGDLDSLSIYANQLIEKGKMVHSGVIRELSLVLAGANPGAKIDHLTMAHSDGTPDTELEDEALIAMGLPVELQAEVKESEVKHAGDEGRTVGDVVNSMTDEQKNVMYALIAQAMDAGPDNEAKHSNLEGDDTVMKQNVFEPQDPSAQKNVLTHSQIQDLFAKAQADVSKYNGSFREAFLAHAVTYGIENIDYLFPDARSLTTPPTFVERDRAWVPVFMSGTKHNPFSRIKSLTADITLETARAKGYVKGSLKKEEFFAISKRVTTPTTIYKKQKLDRDDIIDITDFDVVAWLKGEMRFMLDEEIARAALIGDGREADDTDKINETNIRPIYKDADFYAHRVALASDCTVLDMIEQMVRAREHYKGVGNPTMFTTTKILNDMLLVKDTTNRRLFTSMADLEAFLRVRSIVEVPVMEGVSREITDPAPATLNLVAIMVNLSDYVFGADKGGNVGMFDDFDIDYNQYKYLIETRLSGALINPKTALIIEKTAAAAG